MKQWLKNFLSVMADIRWVAALPAISSAFLVLYSFSSESKLDTIVALGLTNVMLAVLSLNDKV